MAGMANSGTVGEGALSVVAREMGVVRATTTALSLPAAPRAVSASRGLLVRASLPRGLNNGDRMFSGGTFGADGTCLDVLASAANDTAGMAPDMQGDACTPCTSCTTCSSCVTLSTCATCAVQLDRLPYADPPSSSDASGHSTGCARPPTGKGECCRCPKGLLGAVRPRRGAVSGDELTRRRRRYIVRGLLVQSDSCPSSAELRTEPVPAMDRRTLMGGAAEAAVSESAT